MTLTLTQKQLDRFKEICRVRMGVELNDTQAREQAMKLLHLVVLTRKPLPNNHYLKTYDG